MHLVIALIAMFCFFNGGARNLMVMATLVFLGAIPLGGAIAGLTHELIPGVSLGATMAVGIVGNWILVWAGIHSLRNWARQRAIRLGQRSDSSPYVERAAPGPAPGNESTPPGS